MVTAAVVAGLAVQPAGAARAPRQAPPRHLTIQSRAFRTPEGRTFAWRGITAFRLAELVAHGREREARRFLDWAAAHHLTVVRVLAMATHLFQLTPEDGERALPRLLDMAALRGLHVEIVALADTADIPADIDAHVKAIGAIAGAQPNALVEIANEPWHPTQRAAVHDARELRRLRDLIPRGVPVALGSAEADDGYAAGDYATVHLPRASGEEGWAHVVAVAHSATLVGRWQKPVISDEPIGAAPAFVPGRRDNEPARFRAAAVMTRLAGLGATFHYEGGLQARVPEGRELRCFNAWNEAWTLLPAGIEGSGIFGRAGDPGSALARLSGRNAGAFERREDARSWIAIVRPLGAAKLQWSQGWRAQRSRRKPGLWLVEARR